MKTCPHCRMADLDDQAIFCHYCAQRVAGRSTGQDLLRVVVMLGVLALVYLVAWEAILHPYYVSYQQAEASRKVLDDTMTLCRVYARVSGGRDSEQRASIEQQLNLYGTLVGSENRFKLENMVRAAGCYPPDLPDYMLKPAKPARRKRR